MAKCTVCGVELTDENWWPGCRRKCDYKCIACGKQYHKQYNKKHKEKKKQYNEQYYKNDRKEIRQQQGQYYKDHGRKMKQRSKQNRRLRLYGITIQQEVDILEAQGNKCAICGTPITKLSKACIDHNHKTGKVRGILCSNCNTGIGLLQEDPYILDKAKEYIIKHKEIDDGN